MNIQKKYGTLGNLSNIILPMTRQDINDKLSSGSDILIPGKSKSQHHNKLKWMCIITIIPGIRYIHN